MDRTQGAHATSVRHFLLYLLLPVFFSFPFGASHRFIILLHHHHHYHHHYHPTLSFTVIIVSPYFISTEAGECVFVVMLKGPDGRSDGRAIVKFRDENGAVTAINTLNETELDGRRIYMRKWLSKEELRNAACMPNHVSRTHSHITS